MDPAESGLFLRQIDARAASLSVLWHGFDLELIGRETQAVLDAMRKKRDEIRGQRTGAASPPAPRATERPGQP